MYGAEMSTTNTPEPTTLVSVLPDVWRWSVWNVPRGLWFNAHLLVVEGVAVLVDPLPMTDAVAASLDAVLANVTTRLVVVTNRDHERAAAELRTRFDARVLVPHADSGLMALVADELLGPGAPIAPALTTVQVAGGKTEGETALFWAARRLLVLGDAAVGRPDGTLVMLPDDKFADVGEARRGVAGLALLGADVVLVGDGDDILAGGSAALAAITGSGSRGHAPAITPPAGARPGC